MFPMLVLDDLIVRGIHPLVWGFLKHWNLLRENVEDQKLILINLLRVMEKETSQSFFKISLSDEIEYFRSAGIDKRELLRSILNLKRTITAYNKINYFFSQS